MVQAAFRPESVTAPPVPVALLMPERMKNARHHAMMTPMKPSPRCPRGRLEAVAVFPAEPGLAERGLADGVGSLYQRMATRGEPLIAGRRVLDISALLAEALAR